MIRISNDASLTRDIRTPATQMPLRLNQRVEALQVQSSVHEKPMDLQSLLRKSKLPVGVFAYTIPTSKLTQLFEIIDDANTLQTVRESALAILKIRLHKRFAETIWQRFQADLEHLIWPELLLNLSLLKDTDSIPFLAMIQTRDPFLLQTQLTTNLLQQLQSQSAIADALLNYRITLTTPFARNLLVQYFLACDASCLITNQQLLIDWLKSVDLTTPIQSVVDHFFARVQPAAVSDELGDWLLQAISIHGNIPLTRQAQACFMSWKILQSIRKLMPNPRQIELLSRYYYAFKTPAEIIDANWIKISLKRMTLLTNRQQSDLYIYTQSLYERTQLVFRTLVEAAQTEDSLLDDAEAASSLSELTLQAPVQSLALPQWPFDPTMVVSARQAVLDEQEKQAGDPTLIEELESGKKMSIIQLSMDDAQYLFARKFFDDLTAFEGLSAIN